MKFIQRIISGLLIAAIVISTVGFTAVSFACPKTSASSVPTCSACGSTRTTPIKKGCCKRIVEHKVLQGNATSIHDYNATPVLQATFVLPLSSIEYEINLRSSFYTVTSVHRPPFLSEASTVRAMLSTFLI